MRFVFVERVISNSLSCWTTDVSCGVQEESDPNTHLLDRSPGWSYVEYSVYGLQKNGLSYQIKKALPGILEALTGIPYVNLMNQIPQVVYRW